MNQAYWLDAIRPAELLQRLLHALVGGARLAVEGDADLLLGAKALPGAEVGPVPPFRAEYGGADMIVLPLETTEEANRALALLTKKGRVDSRVGAVQIERYGAVEFLAGDSFHRECVSVGSSVPTELLRRLKAEGVIEGFYTPSEARKHFGIDTEPT